MLKAIGKGAINIKKLHEVLNKKIKVIPTPNGVEDAEEFIKRIIDPVIYKGMIINDSEIVINASMQSKAALIGRNKRRLLEMQKIVRDFFKRDFRVA